MSINPNGFYRESRFPEKEEKDTSILLVPYSDPITKSIAPSNRSSRQLTNYTTLEQETVNERQRAKLAVSVMNNVAALSALEDYLSKSAPSGKSRYKMIADAYSVSAGIRLGRWQ
jgi:hypothetical protein